MKKILIINNIPTPYRTFLFDEMHRLSEINGFEIDVFYQFQKERERHWSLDSKSFNHIHSFSNKVLFGTSEFYNYFTFNIDLLFLDYSVYDFVIFSPFMSVNNLVLSKIIPKEKSVYWIETNLESTVHLDGFKGAVKRHVFNKNNMYMVPGVRSKKYISYFNDSREIKYFRFPNLIDYNLFSYNKDSLTFAQKEKFRSDLGIGSSTKIVLVAGEVCRRKGSDKLLNIISNVEGDYVILVVGTGELESSLKKHTSKYTNKIIFLGQMNQAEMLPYFALADIFLHLARQDPSPLVCIEALVSGLVLCVSKQTGNADDVIDGNGLIFDVDNNDELISAFDMVINLNETDHSNFSSRSLEIASNLFSPQKVITDFYTELKDL